MLGVGSAALGETLPALTKADIAGKAQNWAANKCRSAGKSPSNFGCKFLKSMAKMYDYTTSAATKDTNATKCTSGASLGVKVFPPFTSFSLELPFKACKNAIKEVLPASFMVGAQFGGGASSDAGDNQGSSEETTVAKEMKTACGKVETSLLLEIGAEMAVGGTAGPLTSIFSCISEAVKLALNWIGKKLMLLAKKALDLIDKVFDTKVAKKLEKWEAENKAGERGFSGKKGFRAGIGKIGSAIAGF